MRRCPGRRKSGRRGGQTHGAEDYCDGGGFLHQGDEAQVARRGLIALCTAPGDDEVTVIVGDETLGEDDPLLAQLLAAATAGLPPAGPAQRRPPVRLALPANAQPSPKGRLCAEHWGFNLHAATAS